MKARQKFLMAAVGLAVIGLAIIYVPRRTETPTAQAEEAAGQRSPDAGHVVEPSAPMAQATDRAVPPAAVGSSSASKADAGRNGAAAGAAAPSMEAPWRRFIDAEIVESRTSQPDARGLVERIRVVRTAMKYPHIRIVEQVPAGNPAGEPVSFAASVADHMVVRVRDGLSEEKVATIARQHGFSVRKKMLAPDTYLIAFDDASIDALPAAILLFSREANAVQYAEADALIFASATAPNDPAFGQLWGMHQSNDKDIDAPEAWDLSQGSSNVVVAVIDTGIDYTHEDLAANLWRNPGEIPNNGTDDDGNGFVDDIYGWDFANDDSDPYDDNSHGTHSAGTIGGMGNNGIGVAGVNWNVRLMAVKFMTAGGSGFASDAVDSVYYTTARGVRLTSNSWGSYAGMQSLRDAIDNAGASNILFVAAAGNDANNNETTPAYPASFASANIISVAATDAGDDLAWFSNYGHTSVDLGAPGVEIYSTVPTAQGRYASFSGTSMATPHVAGACALLAAYSPTLTAAQIKQRILDNTDRSPTLSGKTVSGGRLNVAKALSGSVPLEPPAAPSALSATPFADLIELTWTDNATNETLFVLERRSGSSGFTVLATLTSNTTSRTDTNVMGGVTYTYRIKARNAAGDSAYCSEASATVPGAADAWDPGDDTSAGGTALIAITTNEATHGPHTLSGTDLADWYQVALQAGGAYDFNAIGGSGDTYAELFRDAAATQLVASDDDGGGGLMFRLEHVADATATYYLRVRTYGTGVSAAYNLKYRMTDTANQTPSVSLTSPDSNVVYQAPGSIAIVASASDPDGSIVQVQFYSGTNVLAIDTTAPYAFTWGAVAAGSYALTAVAMDNEGIAATSTTVNVMVNAQPSVTLTEPANGAVLIAPTNVAISAAATDPDGVVQSVSFYDGDNLLGTDTTSPFGIVWGSPSVGAHTLVAQVVDDLSGQSVSAPVHVTIDSGTPILSVSPLTVGAECLEGANASSNAFSVVNVGNGTLTYTIVDNAGWLSISPTNGSSVGTPNVHRLMYSSAGLAAGVYSAVVTVEAADADDSPQMVAVTLTVRSADPTIALDTTSLSRTFQIGQPALDDTVAVWNSGAGTLNYTNATDVPWLAVSPTVGTSTGEHDMITVSYDTTGLGEGSHTGAVVVSAAGATNSPQTITVTMSLQPTVGLMGHFVSLSGHHVAPFTNWWGAATNVQAAVDAASDGDTIWVTNGVYVLPAQITISKGIMVKGVGGASNVVIDGGYPSRTNRCFNLNHAAIELDGLTISNGCVRGAGGGVYMAKPALVKNSMITGNYTSTTNNTGSGAGVYMVNGGKLDACSIVRNTILNTNDGGYGGGIWMSNSGRVVRCVISDNDGGPGVGGVLARIASLIDSCVITNNRGGPWSSGGVRILGATIRNSLVIGNRSSGPSGGVDDSNSSYGAAFVENCTIVSNYTSRGAGPLVAGGIVAFATNAPMIVRNTIMLNNGTSNCWEFNFNGRQTNVFHSCSADWLPPGMSNIHVDGLSSAYVFENGYRLTTGSPCIDSGTNMAWMAGATDFAGDPRIANGVADMGAYEFSVLYACISGAVYYAGSQTGQIVVVAGAHTNTVASPSAYGIAGLSVPGSYGVSAFMDVNQNGRRDPAEPFGQYSGNPLIISNDMSDIDITLIDAVSEALSISGNINYEGGYGGRVIVSLLDDSPFNEYLEVALSQGSQATSYPVSGLVGPPPGGWPDEYKTTKMVFRRIPAGTFVMGSPTSELGRISNETQHQVTLTDDFYVGVFEVTQKQWERVMGTWPSYFTNVAFRDTRPVECMTYDAIRGSIAGANWPTSYDVDADSFMGRLRARTGRAFDLPTEAQWEYAGRACSTTALNSGKNITVTGSDCSNLSAVARNLHNGGEPGWGHRESTTSAGTAAVGSYQANMWGLHDIHGNVWEWCLDWYGAYPGTVTDPKGLISGSSRVFRGGGWYHSNLYHRAAYRNYKSPSQGSNGLGFRVVSPSGQDGFTRSIMELEAPGQYVFSNLLGQLNYQVMAYRDINGNGIKDSFEPQGSHYNNPMYLTNSVTNGHITLVDPDTDGDGLSDAYELGYGRYQVVTGSYTWAEAKVDAETRGAHLATITSASEWNAICSVVPDIPCGLWLGGSDEEQEGVWRWVTGEPWGYTRWQPLEPDGNTSQNWLEIWADPSNSDRLWNDIGSTNLVCRPSNALT